MITRSPSFKAIPFTPNVVLPLGEISLELNLIPIPSLVKRIKSSSLIKDTDTNSSFSFKLIAAIPVFFLVLTYSSNEVFLTKPFFFIFNTYLI